MPDFRRRRLRHSHIPAMGYEFSERNRADDRERRCLFEIRMAGELCCASQADLRVSGGDRDLLDPLAAGGARHKDACAKRNCVCRVSGAYGYREVSGGNYSYQSAVVPWAYERAGCERRLDCRGDNPLCVRAPWLGDASSRMIKTHLGLLMLAGTVARVSCPERTRRIR